MWAVLSVATWALAYWRGASGLWIKPCVFRALAGLPCPFCGFTRSVCSGVQGAWAVSMHESPLGLVFAILLMIFFLYHAAACLSGRIITWDPPPLSFRRTALLLGLAVAANWIYRLSMGFDR